MKPHMIITEADVIAAKIRAGLRPTIHLQHKPGSAVHTDEQYKCRDIGCPCWAVLPADPADREPLDILTPFDGMPGEEYEHDDFRSGLGDAYLTYYDSRYQSELPAFTCEALAAFMTAPFESGESDRFRLGYIAGILIAFGESNPAFMTTHHAEPAQD
jgi:hypothetical protein